MKKRPNLHSYVVNAVRKEIRRRVVSVKKLEQLDDKLIAAAIRTLGSPASAGEWLITSAYGLGGNIPAEVATTPSGRAKVINLLGRIEYNNLP